MDEHTTNEATENTINNTTLSNAAADNLRSRMLYWDQDGRARIHINKDGIVEMKLE